MIETSTDVALGLPLPPHTPHAISVSLPKWKDNVDYEKGDERVVSAMVCGYPRFFIHLSIQKLAKICEQKFAAQGERAMLFPTLRTADQCRQFLLVRSPESIKPRLVHFRIRPEDKLAGDEGSPAEVHIVLFPEDSYSIARQFWQHTGTGISTRYAEYCLSFLSDEPVPTTPVSPNLRAKFPHRHYSAKPNQSSSPGSTTPVGSKFPHIHYAPKSGQLSPPNAANAPTPAENLTSDQDEYLEERYGRNLPISAAAAAKRALRRRIAGVLVRDVTDDCDGEPCAGIANLKLGPSTRGVSEVQESDVYLYPGGMTAIYNAHQTLMGVRPGLKSVCFGFPYTDTLKVLQKWGPGCHFYGHGLDHEIDDLEKLLEEEHEKNPSQPPILAIFTEFPGNPLLRSADLPRLRSLADKYDFPIVIDETIGNFINVETLKYADVMVSSLTKIFSGSANVMGGSLVLNPQGSHYGTLKQYLDSNYEDFYFDQDAVFLERNSRDFEDRIRMIDKNTEIVCDFLRAHTLEGGCSTAVIKQVFYPKYVTREHYEKCRIKGDDSAEQVGGGFGGLFSLTFTTLAASRAFFDALSCHKGPSLGTNFTLASPFVVLAHFTELDWAAQYGAEEGLVRVSIGLEDTKSLLSLFEVALRAAESA